MAGLEWFSLRKRLHSNDDENWAVVSVLKSRASVGLDVGRHDEIWKDLSLLDNLVDEYEL